VLSTRYVNAGDVVIRRDEPTRSVFFIASGAVELETVAQTLRLGRGEMFGQIAILVAKHRRTEARAIAPSTLLALDEPSFRRLLNRSEAFRKAVEEAAARRGIPAEALHLIATPAA
jgi:CPA1 family monovalent cation:H+ antiporter